MGECMVDECPNYENHTTRFCPLIVCKNCETQGHGRSDCPESLCGLCQKYGHIEYFCGAECDFCNEKYHEISSCPIFKCNMCLKHGHLSKNCTASEQWVERTCKDQNSILKLNWKVSKDF